MNFRIALATLVTACSSFTLQQRSPRRSWHQAADDAEASALFELDPLSTEAKTIVAKLGLDDDQYDKLVELSHLVVDWNSKINLVSRVDCRPSTVFGRHVLPSAAAVALSDSPLASATTAIDVGTGGGFPGLPLAICYPNVEFCLLDSVGKKLLAVGEMAASLGLENVRTHHGRAEDYRAKFDVATGRSVSSIPTFCAWMQHLLRDDGHSMYWIGGKVEASIASLADSEHAIADLVDVFSDKRIFTFAQPAVRQMAKDSGIVVKPQQPSAQKKPKPERKPKVKGAWGKRASDEPRQRGYENFKRYSSQ